jgi:mono/diheme cytochrome c family protein
MQAAGSVGTQGPDLDVGFGPSREQGFEESTFQQIVREQIAFPGIDSPMPPNLVEGEDADNVSYFVAQCAGNPGDAQCAPPGGGEITATEGGEIFAQAGCGNCHTLAAAGSSGTIGPNLDEAQPSHDLVTERVTNGMGAMPPFKDQLSEDQIEAVSDFVAENAGG